jgi:hypothetical protein
LPQSHGTSPRDIDYLGRRGIARPKHTTLSRIKVTVPHYFMAEIRENPKNAHLGAGGNAQ